jgi:GT2 family glycosyltransferase
VISVIVYGRNDAHGYNLHRRAALSLNCIAELLTDPDDEIVFVDYNTPDELPTFIEALADTLTDRCLELLRVFRVPAAIHERHFAARTHLPAIEPVARNAGVRRANPSNRWLLSTNTDMIFLSTSDQSLSEICRELPDGFYGLPRFELPEWLWERLPRSDPNRAMAELERLGPGLRLDEPTVSNEWIRFDAPGDFQLILREDFLAIDGLDEEMLLGYHVDSNLSKRILLYRGSIESLGDSVAGYHCNHNREPTVYHGTGKVANDLERFVFTIDQPTLPAQRTTWGLAGVALEEVSVRERSGLQFAATLAAAIPSDAGPRTPSDAARVPFELTYDSGHVLPFIADSLAVSPPDATIGYVGANPVLQRMLARVVERLGFEDPLEVAKLDDLSTVEDLSRTADVLVVDLGVDASIVDDALSTVRDPEPEEFPVRLDHALDAFDRLIELERSRFEVGEHPRRFVLVHSWTVFWDTYVLANMDCSHTTAHSRVRRATVRPTPVDDGATRAALIRERRLVRWATRGKMGERRLHVRTREAVEPGDLSDYGGFGDGWAYPEESGIWTQGSCSELALALDEIGESDYVLALSLGSICVGSDGSLRVEALVNGERVAGRDFRYGDPDWHIELPARARADGQVDLTFVVEEPSSPLELGWSTYDDRRLGVLLRTVTLVPADDDAATAGLARERRLTRWGTRGELGRSRLHVRRNEAVGLTDLSDYGGFGEGWMLYPDQAGIWTEGSRSELALALDEIGESDYVLALSLASICIGSDASLRVEALLNGERAAARDFKYGDAEWRIASAAPVPADGDVDFTLMIEEPRSPLELGWSADDRRLGLLLHALTLEEVDRSLQSEEKIVFTEGSGAERLLGEGWSALEPTGVWTDGETASLVLKPDTQSEDVELVLSVDAFVTPDHPELKVDVSAKGDQLGARVFRHRRGAHRFGRAHRPLRVVLPASARDEKGRAVLDLRLRDPASPLDLGLSDDARHLGLQLRSLTARRPSGGRRFGIPPARRRSL